MRTSRSLITALTAIVLLLMPIAASAQAFVLDVVGNVGWALFTVPAPGDVQCSGVACPFIWLADGLFLRLRPLLVLLAGIMIVIQGYRMIIAQEDDALDKSKTVITACVSGIASLYLYRPFVFAFFGGSGSILNAGQVDVGASIVSTEVAGMINWALILVAALAVIFIIISGLRAVASAGSEDGTANLRKTVIGIAAGIFLLVFRVALNQFLGLEPPDTSGAISPANPAPNALILVDAGITLVKYVLGFLGVVAVGIFIYAGILMMLGLGNDENVQKGKSLLTRAAIGIIVIVISLALVNFVVQIG